jgi:hypothetical protein
VLDADQARKLLDSIPIARTVKLADGTIGAAPDLVGLRDRALISVMPYAFRRISAPCSACTSKTIFRKASVVGSFARKRWQAPRDAGTP